MSITASFGQDLKNIERDLLKCSSQAPRAIAMSVREAVTHSKSFAKSKISGIYNISPSNVAKTLSTRASGMAGELKAKSPMIPILKAGSPQPPDPRFGKGPELTVSVVKG